MTLGVGVLVSGRGTNLQAILDACATGSVDARVVLVASNRPGVPALDRAPRAAVLASGATESGCPVHRVHPETVDLGEVVVQRRVPVLPDDDAASLAARVLEQEHVAIVDAIRRFVPATTRV